MKMLLLGGLVGIVGTLVGLHFGAQWAAQMLSRLLGT